MECGKRQYHSAEEARWAARVILQKEGDLARGGVYQCSKHVNPTWHWGHRGRGGTRAERLLELEREVESLRGIIDGAEEQRQTRTRGGFVEHRTLRMWAGPWVRDESED